MHARLASLASFLAIAATGNAASLSLPAIFADHMVLQQGQAIRVWGQAEPGHSVRVTLAGRTARGTADASGGWDVTFDPLPAGMTPHTLLVTGDDETIEIDDIVVGEVWLCSGQSNMEWPVSASADAERFIAGADDTRIRMFIVPHIAEPAPRDDTPGEWLVTSPESVSRFSAVAYHFGRSIADTLDTPVGLLHASWGGSAVEAWVPRPVLDTLPDAAPLVEAYDRMQRAAEMDVTTFVGPAPGGEGWTSIDVPGLVEELGHDVDGIMWFRRTVDIPTAWRGRPLILHLGAIDDNDVTYFNGVRVGATNNWQRPRHYEIPGRLVGGAQAVVAVRVEDTGGAGGFSSPATDLRLEPVGGANSGGPVSLAGTWQFRHLTDQPSVSPNHRPANLYNAMIHPWRRYAMRGAIWYQGESNAINGRGEEYFTLFPALIESWRFALGRTDLPFYYVQLPDFTNNEPNTPWRYPVLRQAQLETMRKVPHTGMAVVLELGAANDIHPRNKHDVGDRLARWALSETYGVDAGIISPPIFTRARRRSGGDIAVSFDLYDSRLTIRDGGPELRGFETAGADGVFQPTRAWIEGDQVIVTGADGVTQVRYAWRNNTSEANLANAMLWAASPFTATVK